MKTLTLKANITAPHLSPQSYNHLKYIIEKALNKNGIKVEIYEQTRNTTKSNREGSL